jgi:hypothetical protein
MHDHQEEKMKSKLICATALILFGVVPTALASNWYVDGKHGNDNNNCRSRQHACKTISNAISLTLPGDSIFVAPATYHEGLFIPYTLKIFGSGAKTTIVDCRGDSCQAAVVGSEPKVPVTLSRMTFSGSNGLVDSGGGIYNCFGTLTVIDSIITRNRIRGGDGIFGYGGGIYNCPSSTLTLINTTVTGNSAEIGGAICNGGMLTIINSTFSGNVAHKHRGGGIANYGVLEITNSTFSGNSSGSDGLAGGILNGGLFQSSGLLVIRNSTFSGNTAGFGGGAIFNVSGSAAGLENSVVANNRGGNCLGTVLTKGYNLSSDNSCDFGGPGDLNNIDPMLGGLQNNGGPTKTMALLPGSPAIDAGNPNGCVDVSGHLLKTDQRGMPRPDKEDSGGCDMGAYERQSD